MKLCRPAFLALRASWQHVIVVAILVCAIAFLPDNASAQTTNPLNCQNPQNLSTEWSSTNPDGSKNTAILRFDSGCNLVWVKVSQNRAENNRSYVVGYSCTEANDSCIEESQGISLNRTGGGFSFGISLSDHVAFRLCWSPESTKGPFNFCSSVYSASGDGFLSDTQTSSTRPFNVAHTLMERHGIDEWNYVACNGAEWTEKVAIAFYPANTRFSNPDLHLSELTGTMSKPGFRLSIAPSSKARNGKASDAREAFWEGLMCLYMWDSDILEHEAFADSTIAEGLVNQYECHMDSDYHMQPIPHGPVKTKFKEYWNLESFAPIDSDYRKSQCNAKRMY